MNENTPKIIAIGEGVPAWQPDDDVDTAEIAVPV